MERQKSTSKSRLFQLLCLLMIVLFGCSIEETSNNHDPDLDAPPSHRENDDEINESLNIDEAGTTNDESPDKHVGDEEAAVDEDSYVNPIYGLFADPSVIRAENGEYYVYGTSDLTTILHSTDLVNWEYVGNAFKVKPSWISPASNWAPDVKYFNGKYHLYYTLAEWDNPYVGVGVAVSDSPEGPFEDEGKIFTSEEVGLGIIDPQLFVDEGIPYLLSGGLTDGLFIARMTDDALSLDEEFIRLTRKDIEAPYLIKRDDYYYLFGSPGSCCDGANSTYSVVVGRSKSLTGPYVDQDGNDLRDSFKSATILRGHVLPENGKRLVGPGHISVIQDGAGTDWMFYHAIDMDDPLLSDGGTNRILMMDPIVWEDGWPTIKDRTPGIGEQPKPVP